MKSSSVIIFSATSVVLISSIVISLIVTLASDKNRPRDYTDYLIQNIDENLIKEHLRNLTNVPHPTGSEADAFQALFIKDQWVLNGLDEVNLIPYTVRISRPDLNNDNLVQILAGDGSLVYTTDPHQPPINGYPERSSDDVLPAFNAFAPNATVSGQLLYINYGRIEDFQYLKSQGITINGSIAIIRYGSIFRGDKVKYAEQFGAIGVILYSDPEDCASEGTQNVYPEKIYAPSEAIQLGSLKIQGDLFTPHLPSTEFAYRTSERLADLPKIPVQPISYKDAYEFLGRLSGLVAPANFQGGLNFTYHLGPNLVDDMTVKLEVHNRLIDITVNNVVGVIWGKEEPDRYVLLGNHHDAWIYGGVDPSTATASQLELTRVFGNLVKNEKWRPRRTLVFLSWAAEEDGIMGSIEFTEQFVTQLRDRAVVYINVDMIFDGTSSLKVRSVPLLYTIIEEIAKKIPNPNPKEVEEGRTTVYDTWIYNYMDPGRPGKPLHNGMASGSDYRGFIFNLGIPSADIRYSVKQGENDLPLYHTAYETFHLATDLMDAEMLYHKAVTRMWAVTIYEFSSRHIIPFSLNELSNYLIRSLKDLHKTYNNDFQELGVSLDSLFTSIDAFSNATLNFIEYIQTIDLNKELKLRAANDAMMLIHRAFLNPLGLPDRPLINHMIFAPNFFNGYESEVFPGVVDTLFQRKELGDVETKRRLEEQLADTSFRITSAGCVLSLKLW